MIGGAIIVAAIVVLLLGSRMVQVVQPGTVGVVTYFGAVQDKIVPEGLHFKMPFRTKIIPINVRVQKIEVDATASSKDLQIVSSRVALNFYLDREKANIIFQELGPNYMNSIIQPAIQESVKSATAQFNAEQLITMRPEVKEAILSDLKERLSKNNIIVTDFSIMDFNFSPEFNRAIEEKQVAEQAALRARNDLRRVEMEAAQDSVKASGKAKAIIEVAKAQAEAQRLQRETLSPELLQLRAIEKWDGVLPQVLGEDTEGAFFDVVGAKKATAKR